MPIRFFSAPNFLVTALLLPALLAPVVGRAAEWSAEPSVKLRREYNDNLQLSIYPHESVNGSLITPALNLGVAGPVWSVGLNAEATQRRYSGEEGLDRDDSAFRLASLFTTERSTWQLDASRARDAAVTSEQVDSDTGAVQTLVNREADTIKPSWTWMISQISQLQLAYQQTDVSYGNNSLSAGLYDYRYRTASATLGQRLSELDQIFLYGGYSDYQVPFTSFDSETRSLQGGITRNFSETTKGTLQAGRRWTESFRKSGGWECGLEVSTSGGVVCLYYIIVPLDIITKSTGSVFTGSLESKMESTDWSISLSRSLDPSGSGGQVEQDQFKFALNKRLSPRAGVNINGSALKSRRQEGTILSSDRTFYDLSPGVYWQWTREWSVGANYRYAHVKREYENDAADSNSMNLWLTYKPLKMSVSR